MTNPMMLLKKDHRDLKKLFEAYDNSGLHAYKRKHDVAIRIFRELEAHSAVEEDVFYPALRTCSNPEGRELVGECVEQHAIVRRLIFELRMMASDAEAFEPKIQVLIEGVRRHIEEEETDVFPLAQVMLEADLKDLGEEIASRKKAQASHRTSSFGKALRQFVSRTFGKLTGEESPPQRKSAAAVTRSRANAVEASNVTPARKPKAARRSVPRTARSGANGAVSPARS